MKADGATTGGSQVMVPGQAALDQNGALLTLGELEKRQIIAALQHCKGNRTHAARMLDISIRTLRNKLNDYNYQDEPEPTEGDHVAA